MTGRPGRSLAPGTPEEAGLCPEQVARIRASLRAWVDEGRSPAISALVARRARIVLHEAHGEAAPGVPLTVDRVFPVASVTKPVTATAAMQLVEQGRLSLNRRLRDYVPEVEAEGADEILVHHLMTHCAGYRESDLFAWVAAHPLEHLPPRDETENPWSHRWLHERYRAPLSFKPGTRNSYGIHCIELLGEVVRRVTGRSIGEVVTEQILTPLGMHHSSMGASARTRGRVVQRAAHLPFGNDRSFVNFNRPQAPSAAGGLVTTTRDLAVFAQCFLNGGEYGGTRILSPIATAEMMRNQIPAVPCDGFGGREIREASWGYGWMVQGHEKWPYWTGSLQPVGTVYHQGIGASFVWLDRVHELIGVYLCVAAGFDPATLEHAWDVDHFQNMVTAAIRD